MTDKRLWFRERTEERTKGSNIPRRTRRQPPPGRKQRTPAVYSITRRYFDDRRNTFVGERLDGGVRRRSGDVFGKIFPRDGQGTNEYGGLSRTVRMLRFIISTPGGRDDDDDETTRKTIK